MWKYIYFKMSERMLSVSPDIFSLMLIVIYMYAITFNTLITITRIFFISLSLSYIADIKSQNTWKNVRAWPYSELVRVFPNLLQAMVFNVFLMKTKIQFAFKNAIAFKKSYKEYIETHWFRADKTKKPRLGVNLNNYFRMKLLFSWYRYLIGSQGDDADVSH